MKWVKAIAETDTSARPAPDSSAAELVGERVLEERRAGWE